MGDDVDDYMVVEGEYEEGEMYDSFDTSRKAKKFANDTEKTL
jgi:hypothetical protein